MQKNDSDFFYFNSELCTTLKKLSYDQITPNIRNDYTSLLQFTPTLQTIFNKYASPVYTDKDGNDLYLNSPLFNGNISLKNIYLEILPSFRIIYKNFSSFLFT